MNQVPLKKNEAYLGNGKLKKAGVQIDYTEEQLKDNIEALIGFMESLKPTAAKGTYIRKVALSATMLPGIIVSL